jgi:stage II sporulation protein GA (sporulation sigma-E factor processing peptidase)
LTDVIYIDVLIAINLFATWLLLAASVLFSAVRAKPLRLLLGALLGGAAALLIFLPPLPWWGLLPLKLLCSAAIVFAAYGFGGWRRFARCLASFFGVNFAFAGIMMALWFAAKPAGMFYQNGAVYFNISLPVFILLACACYAIVRGVVVLLRRRHPGANACRATVHAAGASITLEALYDSGNQLTDGFTGAPVAVAEFAALRGFLPERLHSFFQGGQSLAELPADDPWRVRLRTVPFHAMGHSGLLPAFRADQIAVRTGESAAACVTPGALVAVTADALSDGTYAMILQAGMWEARR